MINPETKTFRVFSALRSGEALTASKAKKMGVGNLSAEVSRIREHGFAVYANSRTAGNGGWRCSEAPLAARGTTGGGRRAGPRPHGPPASPGAYDGQPA